MTRDMPLLCVLVLKHVRQLTGLGWYSPTENGGTRGADSLVVFRAPADRTLLAALCVYCTALFFCVAAASQESQERRH